MCSPGVAEARGYDLDWGATEMSPWKLDGAVPDEGVERILERVRPR